MTVNTATASASYDGNGTTQIFTVPFYFLVDGDVKISKRAVDGTVSVLVLNSDYTLTGAGNTAGGSATLVVAPATGETIFIERNVSAVQTTAYPDNGPFPAASHEKALDRLTMLVQQIGTALGFKLGKGALDNSYDVGGNKVSNAADGTAGTDLTTLQQVINLVNSATTGVVNYVASGVGAVTRAVLDKLRERSSVADYGADPTGAASSVTAFNAALTACDDVFIPPGTYLIDDAVSLATGKRLRGAGRRKTILRMPSTFNASALGALVFTGGEPGPEVSGLTITQDQPDSATATVYPPCIYAQNTPRFVLRSLRLSCVYAGIDMKGNSGGAVIDDLELSPLSIGIDIDGSLDSVKISKLHLWPFDLTTNQRTSYTAAYGIKSGRCDDLHLSDSLLFSMIKAAYFYNSASGYTFGSITGTDFDDRGGLNVVTDGRIQLSSCTMTMGKTDSWFVKMTGGSVSIDGTRFSVSAVNGSANGMIEQTGGTLSLGAGCVFSGSSFDVQMIYSANAILRLTGLHCGRATNIAYTTSFIRVINSKGTAVGCYGDALGTGSSKFIAIDTDSNPFLVRDNNLAGWSVSVPASSALANTVLQGNLGSGTNKDEFSGYFSSDATTTVKLPSGWSVSRLGAGNYQVAHNLSLSDAKDLIPTLSTDLAGGIAIWDIASSLTSGFRVRTYVGTTATDAGVCFSLRRYRS